MSMGLLGRLLLAGHFWCLLATDEGKVVTTPGGIIAAPEAPKTPEGHAEGTSLSEPMSGQSAVGESGAMLIGAMAFVMVIFYLVNARNPIITSTTWTMVNLAVSIFCAVLWYDGWNKVLALMFDLDHSGDTTVAPTSGKLWSRFLQLAGWWYFIILVLFLCRNSMLKLKAFGTVAGHILGFAAIYFFGDMAHSAWFNDSCWKVWVVIIINFVVFFALIASYLGIKKLIERRDRVDQEEIDAWHEQVWETKNDWCAMALAFLLVFFTRWWIHGEPVTIDGELGADGNKAFILLGLGVFTLILAIVQAGVHHSVSQHACMDYVSATIATTAAFLLIFGLMWKVGDTGHSELMGQITVATTLTIFCTLFTLGLAFAKHMGLHIKPLRAAIFATALSVGLSWEKVFDAAMHGFAHMVANDPGVGHNETTAHYVEIMFTYFYVFLVFPAWMLYILPKTDEELQTQLKTTLSDGPLPCRACCFDEDLYEDYEDYEDDDSDGADNVKPADKHTYSAVQG